MISRRHVHHRAPAGPIDSLENKQSDALDEACDNSGAQAYDQKRGCIPTRARDGLSMGSVLTMGLSHSV